jgi:hypothetical protein
MTDEGVKLYTLDDTENLLFYAFKLCGVCNVYCRVLCIKQTTDMRNYYFVDLVAFFCKSFAESGRHSFLKVVMVIVCVYVFESKLPGYNYDV